MTLADDCPIPCPSRPSRGRCAARCTLPGSKSLTNRALLLAALCDGPVTLTNALFSEDTALMAAALSAAGLRRSRPTLRRKTIRVTGQGGKIPAPSAELFVGNAGTVARFLTALCAAAPRGVYRLDGVPPMRKRPMKGLLDALRTLGADIRCPGQEGFLPLEIHARGLRGGAGEHRCQREQPDAFRPAHGRPARPGAARGDAGRRRALAVCRDDRAADGPIRHQNPEHPGG